MRLNSMSDWSDSYYIQRIRDGDVDYFSFLVARYEKQVFTLVSGIVNDHTDSEDITQEIFIKVFEKLDQFKGESKFSTWLYRVAYNTAISLLRKKNKKTVSLNEEVLGGLDELPYSMILEEEGEHEQNLQLLDCALSKLRADDALIITLYYLNNKSLKEVSEITQLSIANTKVKLHRIRKLLQTIFLKMKNHEYE